MTTADNQQVVNKSDLLILAVKPKDVENVLKNIRDSFQPKNHLLISIAAGIRTKTIEQVSLNHIPLRIFEKFCFFFSYFNQKVELYV